MALVSICIPAYKNADFLIRALDSILLQTFSDYEIIITDDTPDDSLKAIVEEKYEDNDKLLFIKNPKTLGSTANWNFAVSLARTNLIKILHHDDWFTDQHSLQKFVDPFLVDPKIDFVFCQSRHYVENRCLEIKRPGSSEVNNFLNDPSVLFYKNIIITPSSTLYKKSTLKYDERLAWMTDADFYVSYAKNAKLHYITEPLINLNVAQGRLTSDCEDDVKLLLDECIYLLGKYEQHTYAKTNILKYYRKIVRQHKLYNPDKLVSILGSNIVPAEMKVVSLNIGLFGKAADMFFRMASKLARKLLGENYKIYIRNTLKSFKLTL